MNIDEKEVAALVTIAQQLAAKLETLIDKLTAVIDRIFPPSLPPPNGGAAA